MDLPAAFAPVVTAPWSYGSFASRAGLSVDAALTDDELRGRHECRERFSNGAECSSEGVSVTVQR